MKIKKVRLNNKGVALNNFIFSKRSIKNMKDINPNLLQVTQRALQLSPIDFGITEGRRSIERQKQLFSQGKSQTMNSRHLTGHAVDVVAYVNGNVNWTWKYYEQIADAFKQASKELSIPIEWGGDWTTLKDGPHFQLPFREYPVCSGT